MWDQPSDHYLLWLDAPATETEKPSLPKLLDLEVVEKIGTEYEKFGTFLLKDDTGVLVDAIERDFGKTHRITRKILQEWLARERGACDMGLSRQNSPSLQTQCLGLTKYSNSIFT